MNNIETVTTQKPEPSDLVNSDLPKADRSIEIPLQSAATEVSQRLLSTERSFRVAVAQITTDPGKIEKNTQKIVEKIVEAKRQGAQLVVFPEATIPGYCSMDLQFNPNYIGENIKALDAIKAASDGIAVVVGFVDRDLNGGRPGSRPKLYNSAAVIKDGKILDVQDKTLLPTYDIFFEDRYYSAPRNSKVTDLGKIKIGTTICEDKPSLIYF